MPLRATLLDQAAGCWRVTEPGLWGTGTAWVGTAVERLLLLWARAPPVPGRAPLCPCLSHPHVPAVGCGQTRDLQVSFPKSVFSLTRFRSSGGPALGSRGVTRWLPYPSSGRLLPERIWLRGTAPACPPAWAVSRTSWSCSSRRRGRLGQALAVPALQSPGRRLFAPPGSRG